MMGDNGMQMMKDSMMTKKFHAWNHKLIKKWWIHDGWKDEGQNHGCDDANDAARGDDE
jgi:hypothetical protein